MVGVLIVVWKLRGRGKVERNEGERGLEFRANGHGMCQNHSANGEHCTTESHADGCWPLPLKLHPPGARPGSNHCRAVLLTSHTHCPQFLVTSDPPPPVILNHSPASSAISTPPSSPMSPSAPSVLVIYSPNTPEKSANTLRQFLIQDLRSEYGINATSHDWCVKGSLAQWIEANQQKATAVLCVCNEQFIRDWNEPMNGSKRQVVHSLKQLVYAAINQGKDLSNFATILMRQSDKIYIPSGYFQNTPTFLVTEVEKIAQFVKDIPPFAAPVTTLSSSTSGKLS